MQMHDTYILKIDRNIEKDDFDRLFHCVSEEKKERINRYHRFEDAQRALLGDILARYAICKRVGIRNRDLAFETNAYGKPLLRELTGIHFNISHSGNWVICAIDDNAVGVDVEMIKPIDLEIAERFFSRDEYRYLMNQPEEMKLKCFYMFWTLKESYIKTEGKGLSIPLNSFTIKLENNDIKLAIGDEIREFYFYQSFPDPDTVYAICTLNRNAGERIHWNMENFLKEAQNDCFI